MAAVSEAEAGADVRGATSARVDAQGCLNDVEGGDFWAQTARESNDSPGTLAGRRGGEGVRHGATPREGTWTAASASALAAAAAGAAMEADEAVRVVGTCATSDRGILALYGR